MTNCIFTQEQYIFFWKISFLSLISCIYAICKNHYDLALVPGGVFLTSINYWRYSDYSWRRYVDMIYVKLALIYQIYRAYNAEYCKLYYLILFITMLFYPLGIYFYKRKLYWYSVYAHSMIHILGNISNIILYSGEIALNNYHKKLI
jgi:hypothetical protein